MVGIDRRTHYEWMSSDEVYAERVVDVNNMTLDFAETALYKQIRDGNVASTIFLLKTRGRDRGYIEKHDVVSSDRSMSPITKIEFVSPDEKSDD